jgi:hypothetical protein
MAQKKEEVEKKQKREEEREWTEKEMVPNWEEPQFCPNRGEAQIEENFRKLEKLLPGRLPRPWRWMKMRQRREKMKKRGVWGWVPSVAAPLGEKEEDIEK